MRPRTGILGPAGQTSVWKSVKKKHDFSGLGSKKAGHADRKRKPFVPQGHIKDRPEFEKRFLKMSVGSCLSSLKTKGKVDIYIK